MQACKIGICNVCIYKNSEKIPFVLLKVDFYYCIFEQMNSRSS